MVLAVANDLMRASSYRWLRSMMAGFASNGQADLTLCCTVMYRQEFGCWW